MPGSVPRKPLLQTLDHRRRVDDRVLVWHDVADAGIAQPAMDPNAEPAQANLFPGHRVARFRQNREVAAYALFEHERAAVTLPDICPARSGPTIRRQAASTQANKQ